MTPQRNKKSLLTDKKTFQLIGKTMQIYKYEKVLNGIKAKTVLVYRRKVRQELAGS